MGIDRFKILKTGGFYANTTAHVGSLKENKFHIPKKVNREDIPNGRPLW